MFLRLTSSLIAAFLVAAAIPAADAQTAVTLYGSLSNFDVLNDTGRDAYGFEIEIRGVSSIGGSFSWNRYGAPQVVPVNGGVYVRYMAAWDPAAGKFVTSTPPAANLTPTTGHQCVLGTLNYQNSGCEHFGVWTVANPAATYYRWMFADPANPGKLLASSSVVAIPAPTWTIQPPAVPAGPPVVAVDVAAPVPPKPAEQYGDAQWMKVYKTESPRQVQLDELVADNAAIPMDPAQVETNWYLVQAKIGGNGKRNQKRNQGGLGRGNQAVVRRFEFYKFTGQYDPATHEAICADGLCDAPSPGELGNFIGAQNAAANLNVPAQPTLSVATSGNGQVQGTPGSIKCPAGACSATVAPGTVFTLTANPGSGTAFTGWGGACAGLQLTCAVTLDSTAEVTADFKSAFTLSIGRSGKGVITSEPAGIACGVRSGNCSAKFAQGTDVTLSAVPDAGSTWSGWSGACTGGDSRCTVTISKDTAALANFK